MSKRGSRLAVGALCAFFAACAPSGPDGGDETDPTVEASAIFDGDPANGAVFALDLSVWEGPMSQKEMDCFWDSGVRHIVVGTQYPEITHQQLAMAVSRGMTVDGYVYLYWDTDVKAQVDEAFHRTAGYPIGRMWLDIEEPPGSNVGLAKAMQDALDECRMHDGVECGVYTGPGFWKTYTGNSTALSDAPLWYALYNHGTSLSAWSTERFGGWTKPVAKQFAEEAICGVGPDKDVMQVITQPTVTVDRTLPPDTGVPPPAPGGLYPADGSVDLLDYVKIMSETIPRATSYQLALESWTGTKFVPYYTWTNANAFKKVNPTKPNTIYRFRVRAQNAHGWGAWSSWSTFDYGKYTGPRPDASPEPTPSDPPPSMDPPPSSGVPGSLAPDGGASVPSGSVTMTCSAVTGATSYEFAIEHESGSSFTTYTNYSAAGPSRTFWPQISGTYRWRVRAKVNGTPGDWSAYATFGYP